MKKLHISIVGSGVVGQATGKGLVSKGFDVTFIDISSATVELLRSQGFNSLTPKEAAQQNLTADVSLISVSTPTENGGIVLNHLRSAAIDLGKRLKHMPRYHTVVIRSTVPPGTTEEMIIPLLEKHSGKRAGEDFGVCMNPEYLREASAEADFSNPWIVVIGQYDRQSGDVLEELYQRFGAPIYRVSLKEAEFQKYVHNLYNAAKISFFNEMRLVAERLEMDPEQAFQLTAASCEGLWNPRYGTRKWGPFSGMCLPKDTSAFLDWANSREISMPLLKATIEVNDSLREHATEAAFAAEAAAVTATPA